MVERFIKNKDWSSIWYLYGEDVLEYCADCMLELGHKKDYFEIKMLMEKFRALPISHVL